MARLVYADAIVKNVVTPKTWNNVRNAATQLVDAEKIVDVRKILADFSPDKYLLTHATIVASVDVEPSPLASDGKPYYIKESCSKYVNQNGDCWERELLLNTFRSFVGAYNYLEHVQIPQLSKGRIIDAVARPVDDNGSIYIDILVATSKIHRSLVASIESGEMGTLSMGCSIKYSRCSKCGRKAADEVDLCDHIRYSKNQFFYDENGVKRIIAELCGDKDDPDSNVFIEASWVANPAFQGAVLRNIILAKEDDREYAEKIERAYIARKKEPVGIDGFLKAASLQELDVLAKKMTAVRVARNVLAEAGIGEEEKEGSEKEPKELADPFDAPVEGDEKESEPKDEQETAKDKQSPNYQEQFEQVLGEPGDKRQEPAGEQPAGEQPTGEQPQSDDNSIEGIKDKVKKEIRQNIIDELTKELQENVSSDVDDNEGWNTNESLVTAFVNVYKPKTKFSSAKLTSIFNMLIADETGGDFSKVAYSPSDYVDFFKFVDRFQVVNHFVRSHKNANFFDIQLEKAAKLGTEAFEKGLKAVPMHDPSLQRLIKDAGVIVGSETWSEMVDAWSKAWHKANLAAPVPGMTDE